MAKKVRRVRKQKPSSAEGTQPAEPTISSKRTAATTDQTAEEFEQEYSYVLRDLRRVFVLAALMFVLLIALNLLVL